MDIGLRVDRFDWLSKGMRGDALKCRKAPLHVFKQVNSHLKLLPYKEIMQTWCTVYRHAKRSLGLKNIVVVDG